MVSTLDDLLEEIYSDNRVSVNEYMQIRDFADEKMQVLINRFGKHNSLTAFQK